MHACMHACMHVCMYACMYVCMYYQCHENCVCRNGFDGFRLYHDSTIWDSLKRSRGFHTITCRSFFKNGLRRSQTAANVLRRSQTVSGGLRLHPCFRFFFGGWFSVKRSQRYPTVGNNLDGFSTQFFCFLLPWVMTLFDVKIEK